MKSKKLIEFEKEWDAITLMKLFEEKVIDKRTGEEDYIIFDISIQGRSFVAQHVGLTAKQERSKFIATTKIVIDPDFSLDENLQELYSACIDAILYSDFYELSNED